MGISVTARNRRHQAPPESGPVWVGPTRAAARRAASRLRGAHGPPPGRAESLAAFARGPGDAVRLVLCPAGRSVAEDLAFLREARRRVLWPGPPWLLRDAVAGLLNLPDEPAGASRGGPGAAILLEGTVDSRRAERVLAIRGPRLWILSDVRRARLSGRRLERLERRGVRFCALRPVSVEAIVASPALAAARRRWKSWLPQNTPILLLEPPGVRPSSARSRRSSRR